LQHPDVPVFRSNLAIGLDNFGYYRGLRPHDYRMVNGILREWAPLLCDANGEPIFNRSPPEVEELEIQLCDGGQPAADAEIQLGNPSAKVQELAAEVQDQELEEWEVQDHEEWDGGQPAADTEIQSGDPSVEESEVQDQEFESELESEVQDQEEWDGGQPAADTQSQLGDPSAEVQRQELESEVEKQQEQPPGETVVKSSSVGGDVSESRGVAKFPPPMPMFPLTLQPIVHIYVVLPSPSSSSQQLSSTGSSSSSVPPPPPPAPPASPPPPPAPPASPPPRRRSRSAPRQGLTGWCKQCRKKKSDCFKHGDWECPTCGRHNYAGRSQCTDRRCPSAGETWCKACRTWRSCCFKDGDWACPCCQNHNYASKEVGV